ARALSEVLHKKLEDVRRRIAAGEKMHFTQLAAMAREPRRRAQEYGGADNASAKALPQVTNDPRDLTELEPIIQLALDKIAPFASDPGGGFAGEVTNWCTNIFAAAEKIQKRLAD
ncbi:MAG TPA: hypothetical protein VGC46_03385, partial [Allosphingosinicella sp.]